MCNVYEAWIFFDLEMIYKNLLPLPAIFYSELSVYMMNDVTSLPTSIDNVVCILKTLLAENILLKTQTQHLSKLNENIETFCC